MNKKQRRKQNRKGILKLIKGEEKWKWEEIVMVKKKR